MIPPAMRIAPATHFHTVAGVCCFSFLSDEWLFFFCKLLPVLCRRRLSSEKERLRQVSRLLMIADMCCLSVRSGGERQTMSHWRILLFSEFVFIAVIDSEQCTGKRGYFTESDQYGVVYLASRGTPEPHEQQDDSCERQDDGDP